MSDVFLFNQKCTLEIRGDGDRQELAFGYKEVIGDINAMHEDINVKLEDINAVIMDIKATLEDINAAYGPPCLVSLSDEH